MLLFIDFENAFDSLEWSFDHGGLKMVDLSSFNKSFKTSWIRKYLDTSNHGKWKEFVELDLEKYGWNLIFRGNLHKSDSLKTISVKNNFTRELLEIWCEVNFEEVVKTKEHFLEQPIWHNSLIRIENKPVFDKTFFSLGISKVKDFVKEQQITSFPTQILLKNIIVNSNL